MTSNLLGFLVGALTFVGSSSLILSPALAATKGVQAPEGVVQKGVGGAGPGGAGSYRDRTTGDLKLIAEVENIFRKAADLGSKVYAPYYDISDETQAELRKILAQLPFSIWTCPEKFCTLGKPRGTFIDHTKIDPVEYDKIKSDYRKVIQSYGKKFDEVAFVLAAYSKGELTYILKAYEDHKALRQAMILIHEASMRLPFEQGETTAARLAKVLELDSAIWDILRHGKNEETEWRFLNALVPLGYRSRVALKEYKFRALASKLGRPFLLSELVTDPAVYRSIRVGLNVVSFDPRVVQKFDRLERGIAEHLEPCSLLPTDLLESRSYSPFFDRDVEVVPERLASLDSRDRWLWATGLDMEGVRELNGLCRTYSPLLAQSRFQEDKLLTVNKRGQFFLLECRAVTKDVNGASDSTDASQPSHRLYTVYPTDFTCNP